MRFFILFAVLLAAIPLFSAKGMDVATTIQEKIPENTPYASFAGGCFWCMESEFRRLEGVLYTRSGYEGGTLDNPTYEDITTGRTGHAETVEIYYDPEKITYRELADHFLRRAHDPTTLNRQGVDEGTQYRSAIFYHDEAQKKGVEGSDCYNAGTTWNILACGRISPAILREVRGTHRRAAYPRPIENEKMGGGKIRSATGPALRL